MQSNNNGPSHSNHALDDADALTVGRAIWSRRRPIVAATLAAAMLSLGLVNLMSPKYKSEARVLIENRENSFTRPNGTAVVAERQEVLLDQEAIRSNIQLILSRDLAREAAERLKLAERSEFDPARDGVGPLKRLFIVLGLSKNPMAMSPEERVLESYYDKLTVFSIDRSRVISIEFTSKDPQLSAEAANTIAALFLEAQKTSKRSSSGEASQWLLSEIEQLRNRVTDAEDRVERFRASTGIFVGNNNISIASQQLADLNQQVASARSAKADAEARAKTLRELIKSARVLEGSEVANSELLRRLSEQRINLRAALALESQTFLPQHPRIKELSSQINDLESQIKVEVERAVRSLETEAKVQEARVEALMAAFETQKKQVAINNASEVQLRALEREARAQREQLESFLGRYREASARESNENLPPDARIISRALVVNEPASPQKLAIIALATFGTLVLMVTGVVAGVVLSAQPANDNAAQQPLRQPSPQRVQRVAARREDNPAESEAGHSAPAENVISVRSNHPAPHRPVGRGGSGVRRQVALKVEAIEDLHEPQADAEQPKPNQDPRAMRRKLQALVSTPHVMEQPSAPQPVISPVIKTQEEQEQYVEQQKSIENAVARADRLTQPVIILPDESQLTKPAPETQRIFMMGPDLIDQNGPLSIQLAQHIAADTRTILIEMNPSRSISQALDLGGGIGLLHIASGKAKYLGAIRRAEKVRFDTLPLGDVEEKVDLTPQKMNEILKYLAQDYQSIIIDAPQLEGTSFLKKISSKKDICIVVSQKTGLNEMNAIRAKHSQSSAGDLMVVSPKTLIQSWKKGS